MTEMADNAMGADGDYDLIVIGGGINGAGIARDAAMRGLKVFLCEKGDIGGATSAASSKLIHGGLRYLEQYEFSLVRKALAEREVLLRVAPHIIWPLRFVLPHNKLLRPAWMIRIGLFLYDHIGGRRTLPGTKTLDLRRTAEGAPLKDTMTKGFAYSDGWVEDSRLVILNVMDAERHGADIAVRSRCIEAYRDAAVNGPGWAATVQDAAGNTRTVRGRVLINAAGPWVDSFLRQSLGRNGANKLQLIKGSHIVVRRLYEGDHAYILQNTDRRVIFAIPYQRAFTLIGTTDVPFNDDPAEAAITPDEIDYLLAAVNGYFNHKLTRDDIVHTYAGVRPLYDDHAENPSAVTRDYAFDIENPDGQAPLLSIYGGKITTYRKLADHAVDKLRPHLGRVVGPCPTADHPLPGGDMPGGDFNRFLRNFRDAHPWLPEWQAWRYSRLYGSLAETIVGGASGLADLGHHFGADLYEREVDYLIDHEYARTAEDILWRRTKLGLHLSPDEADSVAHWVRSAIAARRLAA